MSMGNTERSARRIHVRITGLRGAGKTVVANVLRQAFSEDKNVDIIFHESVGRLQDKDLDAIEMEPMNIHISEGYFV